MAVNADTIREAVKILRLRMFRLPAIQAMPAV